MANQSMFDGINKKIFEAEKFITNALSDIEKFGNESVESIESEISDAKNSVAELKKQLTSMAESAEDKAIYEIAKTQVSIENAIEDTKKKIEDYKTKKDKEMYKKYIEYLLEYANACTELSSIVANEARVAYLDAIKAKGDYIKEYGLFE